MVDTDYEQTNRYSPGSPTYNHSIAMIIGRNEQTALAKSWNMSSTDIVSGVRTIANYTGAYNVRGGLFTDKTENILWLAGSFGGAGLLPAGEMWVSWAWFEDNIINRYMSYVGNEEVKLTLRSVDTVKNEAEGGVPVEVTDSDAEKFFRNEISSKNSTDDLSNLDTNVTYNAYLKIPEEIGNNSFLKPKKSFDFLTPGQNPQADEFFFTKKDGTKLKEDDKYVLVDKIINDVMNFVPKKGELERNFSKDGSGDTRGYLRNIFINIRQIQKAFGVDATKGFQLPDVKEGALTRKLKHDTVKPPSTIEAGVKALLRQLNDNYFNIWDFEMIVDPFDSTNTKIIDKSISLDSANSGLPYSEFNEAGSRQNQGIYVFPSFKLGSTVKNQSLSFKIPNEMVVTAMYGSNSIKTKIVDSPSHSNSEISTQFQNDTTKEYEDGFLDRLESTNKSWGLIPTKVNDTIILKHTSNKIGSSESSANAKIAKDEGNLIIKGTESPWYTAVVEEQKVEKGDEDNTDTSAISSTDLAVGDYDNAIWHYDPKKKKVIDLRVYINSGGRKIVANADTAVPDEPRSIKQKQGTYGFRKEVDVKLEDLGYYVRDKNSMTYVLIEKVVPVIKNAINGSVSVRERGKSYHQDTIIPAELGLEIDGTEGLIPGDLIHTDYIPKKYKQQITLEGTNYGPFVYFQIFKISHKINSTGWTTDIGTKMRVNTELLNKDQDEIDRQLRQQELIRVIDSGPTNATVLANAQDNESTVQIANQESIEQTLPTYEKTAHVDDFTDKELIMYSVKYDATASGDSVSMMPLLGLNSLIIGSTGNETATELGMTLSPPPLTGLNQDGNKVASIDEGPNGEEIETNSKGQFYYHPNGDTSKSVIVKAKVNSQNQSVIIDKNPKPDEGSVLISDLFSYNAAGDFTNMISEEPTTSVSTEVEEQRAGDADIRTALTNPIEVIY